MSLSSTISLFFYKIHAKCLGWCSATNWFIVCRTIEASVMDLNRRALVQNETAAQVACFGFGKIIF